jgi:hypothetical protein
MQEVATRACRFPRPRIALVQLAAFLATIVGGVAPAFGAPLCRLQRPALELTIAPCAKGISEFISIQGSDATAHYERGYACFREGRFSEALREMRLQAARPGIESIQGDLGEGAVLDALQRPGAFRRKIKIARAKVLRFERIPSSVIDRSMPRLRELLSSNAWTRHVTLEYTRDQLVAQEWVMKEDAFLRGGVAAAQSGDYCTAAGLLYRSTAEERSTVARWLYGVFAWKSGQPAIARAAWINQIVRPGIQRLSDFHPVQWAAIRSLLDTGQI